ncbi:MAG: DUF5686 and carboxypeptidase regulatory-like domain-containing protein [Bacteroidota bacterium]
MKLICTLFAFFLSFSIAFAQLSGTITDQSGEPLPFASIYIKNTSTGTTSNIEGYYFLELAPGQYELVFQYVGYAQLVKQVRLGNSPTVLDIQLTKESISLNEIVVRADAEDPAYPVIRQAMAKRKYYLSLVKRYECDVYVKGNMKVLDAPESFMGVELGDMGGALDSTRQGILYLSESQAKVYYQYPNDVKEVMLSTKVSGNDNGFGFNRASEMDFNLYENHALFGRQIISPIATNAMGYYKYKLLGTFYDEEGRLINKIEVIPKREEDPVYSGVINIVEELWNIQTVDLQLAAGNMKIPGLNKMFIKQVHVPVAAPDTWRIFSQTIQFDAGGFGFEMKGDFQAIFSNYDLEPQFEDGFFNNEIFKVTEGANDKDLSYWDTIRPIPLTQEESVDYVRKDSIQEIRRSKTYLDSIDAKNNKFKAWDLLLGYGYNNSYEKSSFKINSPLTAIQYNTVQGWNADLGLEYRKSYEKYNTKRLEVNANFNYGFADRRFRGIGKASYRFNQTKYTTLTVEGGVQATQFNQRNPITPTLNTLYTILGRRNFMKLYDKSFGKVTIGHELFNGVRFAVALEYAERRRLINTSDYSLFGDEEDRVFTPNNPAAADRQFVFDPSEAVILNAVLRLRYKQKYVTYPDRKFIQGSSLPTLYLIYRKGLLGIAGSDVNFDHIALRLVESYAPVGVLGYTAINVEAGTFRLNDSPEGVSFVDFKHFNGNQTFIGSPRRYMNSFMLLPYYAYSTGSTYVEAHWQHFFEGFLLDKIPGLNKLGWSTVLGAKFLDTNEQPSYAEFSFGIDQIGFGPVRLFRFDVVTSYTATGKWDWGLMLGLRLPNN